MSTSERKNHHSTIDQLGNLRDGNGIRDTRTGRKAKVVKLHYGARLGYPGRTRMLYAADVTPPLLSKQEHRISTILNRFHLNRLLRAISTISPLIGKGPERNHGALQRVWVEEMADRFNEPVFDALEKVESTNFKKAA